MPFLKYIKRLSLDNIRTKSKSKPKKSKSFDIGEPTETKKLYSVKYDPQTKKYTGLPPELEILLKQHGLSSETNENNLPNIYRAYKQSLKSKGTCNFIF